MNTKSGQEVQNSTTTNQIDISALENGLYVLNIKSNNKTQVEKIIKTN
ncbi:T9SS type A sorting domain-containing protein [Xanthomarina sp.]